MTLTIEEIRDRRGFTPFQLQYARNIAEEVRYRVDNNVPDSELCSFGKEGYPTSVGVPDEWWDSNCLTYREASNEFLKPKDLTTVCLLADAIIAELLEGNQAAKR